LNTFIERKILNEGKKAENSYLIPLFNNYERFRIEREEKIVIRHPLCERF
jgi:hypothetical protein